jgi:transcription antitermination factor NusG
MNVTEVAKLHLEENVETVTAASEQAFIHLPKDYAEPGWYAVYTIARHEKRVAEQMNCRRLRGFLPLYRAMHRWKDRRKQVELALFPSYVFVHVALKDRLRVLEIPGVVSFVCSQGKPAPLPEHQIEPLLRGTDGTVRIEPHPYLQAGRRVRLRSGVMAGLEGVLLRRKEGLRLVVSVELLMRSVALEIDEADVEPCHGASIRPLY